MRPRRLGLLLLLAACGDPSNSVTTATAGVTTATTATATGASTSDPSATEPVPTTSTTGTGEPTSATSATDSTGTSEPASATSATDSTGTSEPASATSATDSIGATDTDTASTSSTGEPCPLGQDGCACGPSDACDPGLECAAGLCGPPAPPVCGDGDVEGDEQCDDGNTIPGDGCENDCTVTPAPATDPCGYDADDGVWLEIDYSGAFTSTSPKWTYSPTPGWGESDWAAQGESWPEVWDIYNNVKVQTDQIGKVALITSSGALQIMFGIGGLTYDYATVCVQGRSYATSSPVTFTVQNQLNNCGGTGMMAQDWTIHSTGVDLGTCIVQNNEFQGLRIRPSGGSGSLSLTRLRFTLHGASY